VIKGIEEARTALRKARTRSHIETETSYAAGYLVCYETDPHVRALIEAANGLIKSLLLPESLEGVSPSMDFMFWKNRLAAALRPFEKGEPLQQHEPSQVDEGDMVP
jgi:hypothetical protein